MTDRKKIKTEFGADKEADKVLNRLPRLDPKFLASLGWLAFLAIDVSGRLCIAIDGGGLLSINERDLCYIHGDEIFEA